MRPKTIDFIE